jgi:hypothetical protein
LASVDPLSSPERVKDRSWGGKRDFALLRPRARGGEVYPTLVGLLEVIGSTSFAFIDLGQDETRVAGRSRVEIHRIREFGSLGHVVAQKSFLPATVVGGHHPSPVAPKEAVIS